MSRGRIECIAVAAAVLAAGCSSDPRYIQPGVALEVNAPDSMSAEATTMITLPIRQEREEELTKRQELAEELEIDVSQIPFVTRDDLDISIEWTIRNLEDTDGTARIHVNGANEYFSYEPLAFVEDPEEEEVPPPLLGDVPIEVPAGTTLSGVFREDQVAEASIDLELITRGATNPFAAVLEVHEDTSALTDSMSGTEIPAEAFASLVRFDVTFLADRHMVLELAIRVRNHREPSLLHEACLDLGMMPQPEACSSELTTFSPAAYQPPMTMQ